MGYTHYYEIHSWDNPLWQQAWPQLLDDVRLILEASDVLLSGPTDDERIITTPVVDEKEGIFFNGVSDDRHQLFRLPGDWLVKTNRKPYDLAVACVLLRAFQLAPSCVEVTSDGRWIEETWLAARALYKQLWSNERITCPWDEDAHESGQESLSAMKQIEPRRTAESLSQSGRDFELLAPSQLWPKGMAAQSTLDNFDLDPISNWLATCNHEIEHAGCRATPIVWTQLPGVSLKMIDIEQMCIVVAPDFCSFVALTYVWGNTSQPKLTEQTEPVLMQEGGLNKIWSYLPTTIRDAILLCRNLRERYLWIDALCIKQDCVREMKIQILRMRQIYSAAHLTIAAVSAESADVGLLGTTVKDSPSSGVSTCETVEDLEDVLESAPWSSRAWCYQEKVLSHRILMFTSAGVYMHCQHTILSSAGTPINRRDGTSSISSTSHTRFDNVGAMLFIVPGEDLLSYASAVEFYSKRHLTNLSDKLNAFQGIFKRYQGVIDGEPSAFSFGLPTAAFDQFFCWRSRRHCIQARNPAFPSWSWLGWQGGVEIDRRTIHAARTSQMIYSPNLERRRTAYTASLRLRKPALRSAFGFPATVSTTASNDPRLCVDGSMIRARIAADPGRENGENGLYAIWATSCRHHPPPPPPAPVRMTYGEYLSQPLPRLKFSDDETLAAPTLPKRLSHKPNELMNSCTEKGQCIAKSPLGHIWLDMKWRASQGEQCVMEVLALAGRKDQSSEEEKLGDQPGTETREAGGWEKEALNNKWVITLLMCLQRMEKKGFSWGHERVQVLDCEIREQEWLEAGAKNKGLNLL